MGEVLLRHAQRSAVCCADTFAITRIDRCQFHFLKATAIFGHSPSYNAAHTFTRKPCIYTKQLLKSELHADGTATPYDANQSSTLPPQELVSK